MTTAAATRVFSPADLEAWERDGFLVVRGLFDADEMARVAAWAEEVRALPEEPGRHMVYYEDDLLNPGRRVVQRIENLYDHHDGFRALFDGEKLRGAVGELFGEPAVLFKDKINYKLPGGDGFKPHQDQQAGWSAYADLFITALVSIDQATVENGCLELCPGRHKEGLIGPEWEPLEPDGQNGLAFTPCPTEPGDVVFFDSYAPHGSGPNLTDEPRRILYITYNRASDGDHRARYYADKRRSFPPDIERDPDKEYRFRV